MDSRNTTTELNRPKVPVAAGAGYRIRRLIAEERLGPGDRLPSERKLTERFGVSRTSIRAALKELQAIGLIEIDPARGAFVSRDETGGILTSIRSWVEANRLSLPELVEFRRAIEPKAAGAAARRRDDADLARLREQLDAIDTHVARKDPYALSVADTAFHRRIAEASRNRLFVIMTDSLAETVRVYREAIARLGPPLLVRNLEDHHAIFEAIARGDEADAERQMERHIVGSALDFHIVAREELA